MKSSRDLKKELKGLGIISFDSSGIATRNDVFTALDAIKNDIKHHSNDSDKIRIQALIQERKKRMNALGGNE